MKNLFDEVSLGGLKLKNRFARSATWLALASEDGRISGEFIAAHKALCDGGVGALITEFTRTNKRDAPFENMPSLADDAFVEDFIPLCEYARSRGVAIFAQIGQNAGDMRGDNTLMDRDVNSATIPEIKDMICEFAGAAKRAELAGFNGVQLHAAHGFLLSRFLSSAFNGRRDRYGKALKNRCAVILEIMDAVRKSCSPDFCILAKVNASALGLSEDESLQACEILDENGIDAVEVSGDDTSRKNVRPGEGESYFKDFAARLACGVKAPVILVGGNRSLESMGAILNSSNIEMFSLSRPLIREPDLIKRWQLGDTAPAKCISCNACFKTPGHKCAFNLRPRPAKGESTRRLSA